jgi:hypothetical protein
MDLQRVSDMADCEEKEEVAIGRGVFGRIPHDRDENQSNHGKKGKCRKQSRSYPMNALGMWYRSAVS